MKKLVFSLIATVCMGVSSMNAQTALKGFLGLDGIGFGKVSSYAGPCVSGAGMCMGSVSSSSTFEAGISKVNDSQVSFAFSKAFYQSNLSYLRNGLSVETPFSLPKSVSERIGVKGEFVVAPGVYQVTEAEGYYFVSLARGK